MDFGRVVDLDSVDFSLPEDHPDNIKILNGQNFSGTKVYAGCAKWGRTEWVGKIYPPKTKEKDFLAHYVKHFNCIELNATHYRNFPKETIKGWKSKAPNPEFKFCPKFHQLISHIKRLKNCERETEFFYGSVGEFGENLGFCFLQLPPNFAPKNFIDLRNYLESLPRDKGVCVEFRHPGWFNDPKVSDETFGMLKELGVGSVITDAAGRRDVVHMRLSNSTAFIRFVGNNLHPTDFTRVDDWVQRLKKWMESGLETLYFMMHMHDEKDSPELCAYVVRKLNEQCGLKLKEPEFINTK